VKGIGHADSVLAKPVIPQLKPSEYRLFLPIRAIRK